MHTDSPIFQSFLSELLCTWLHLRHLLSTHLPLYLGEGERGAEEGSDWCGGGEKSNSEHVQAPPTSPPQHESSGYTETGSIQSEQRSQQAGPISPRLTHKLITSPTPNN